MKYIELNFNNNDGKVIVRKDAIECFYESDDKKGSIIHTPSMTLRVVEKYEELRYRLVDPLELQYMLQTSDEPIIHVCGGEKK